MRPAASGVELRPLLPGDWDEVAAIYAAGIATGHATFEEAPPTWAEWDRAHRPDLRLVATEGAAITGWAAAGPVDGRCWHQGVVEHGVYVRPDRLGRGIGRALLGALVEAAEAAGVWTVQAGVFPENEASLALHRACGFRVVGRRERIGRQAGVWRDVLLLERRSPSP